MIISQEDIDTNDRKYIILLMRCCYKYEDRKGLIAILRDEKTNSYVSEARKIMYYSDYIKFGPDIVGINKSEF